MESILCKGCRYLGTRPQKCSCCCRNRHLKDCFSLIPGAPFNPCPGKWVRYSEHKPEYEGEYAIITRPTKDNPLAAPNAVRISLDYWDADSDGGEFRSVGKNNPFCEILYWTPRGETEVDLPAEIANCEVICD